jgi:DNA-binding HxlR family transcriptional regulator
MFRSNDGVCQLSLENLAAEGFSRNTLPETLRRMAEAGFLSRQRGTPRQPDTEHDHGD